MGQAVTSWDFDRGKAIETIVHPPAIPGSASGQSSRSLISVKDILEVRTSLSSTVRSRRCAKTSLSGQTLAVHLLHDMKRAFAS